MTWSPTTEIVERNWALLHDLLETASAPRPERTVVEREIGDFYAAGMDENRIEEQAFKPIEPDLQKIAALKSKDDLPELLADLHERGIGGFFDASVDADARRSDIYAVSFSQGGLGLPDRDYYFGKQFAKEREAYAKHIAKMFTLLGDPAEAIPNQVKKVLEIETALAKASRKLEDLEDPITNYHKLTLAILEKGAPPFVWSRYLAASHAAKTETVIVGQPEFLQAMNALLKTCPLEDLKTYLRWHVLTSAAPFLHEAAVKEDFAFFGTILRGQPQIDPRWKRITRRIDSELGEALGEIYVAHYFTPEARDRAEEMVNNLKAVYHDRLAKVPWMTEGPANRRWRSSSASRARSARPRSFATTPPSKSSGTISWATWSAPRSSNRGARWRASANRSIAANGA